MRIPPRFPLTLTLLLALPACEQGPAEAPAEVRTARLEARSRACLGAELARGAEDNLRTLEGSFGSGAGGAAALIARQAAAYAEAFLQHARLRELAYAQMDSAFNHSSTRADSLEHVQRAEQLAIAIPEAGTVEANVISDYERQLDVLLTDEDHPCNWNLEE